MSEAAATAEAIDWAIRVHHPDFMEWDALECWLAADPRHALLFDRATLAEELGATALRSTRVSLTLVPPPPVVETVAPRWRGWMAHAAIAASLLLVAGAGLVFMRPPAKPADRLWATAEGGRRAITLPDATRIDLNGGTKIALDGGDPRRATLLEGEATFTVRHDAAHPFAVRLGDLMVTDAGTVFDALRTKNGIEIAVAEGSVRVDLPGGSLSLRPGQQLRVPSSGPARIMRIAAAAVGSWRSGQISYAGATLGRVAEDISRMTGVPITTTPDVADNSFAGTIRVGRNIDETLHTLELLLGVRMARQGGGLAMGSKARFSVLSWDAVMDSGRIGFKVDLDDILDCRANTFALGTPFTVEPGTQQTPLRPRNVHVTIIRRL